ncbi:hypothetical protein RRG08_022580 [Elysia crispata]|uniref:Uncharacterized protein n=1 Tax=Elysia crispata TaxID=231223 RepID=A0AAE0Z1G3_9GAST|nr:hypothetical protein RRG08_022580 [Elysia crispata]
MASKHSGPIPYTLSYLDEDVSKASPSCQSPASASSCLVSIKESSNAAFFDLDSLSTSVKEILVVFAVIHDESYGAAVRAVWSMREMLASQNPEAFLRLYLGLCIKDLVHALNLPPALMHGKCDKHLHVLDPLFAGKEDIKKLFTSSQMTLFEKAMTEACMHFKTLFENAYEKEKLFIDYKISEFGSSLSNSLQILARLFFPKLVQTRLQGQKSSAIKKSSEQTSENNPKSKIPSSSNTSNQPNTSRADDHPSDISLSLLKDVQVHLVPLHLESDQVQKNSVKKDKSGKRKSISRRSLKFSDIEVENFAGHKGTSKLQKCSVKLKRIDINTRSSIGEAGASRQQQQPSSFSNGHQYVDGHSSNHNELTKKSSGKRRKTKERGTKLSRATQANKDSPSALDDDFDAESVPSSYLEESDAEDDDMMHSSRSPKKQKITKAIPVPNLQRFIQEQERSNKTRMCLVIVEKLIL